MDQSNESVIGQFLEAAESGDVEGMASLAHDDLVMEWPQSAERFRGKENALAAMRAQETKPEFAGEPRNARFRRRMGGDGAAALWRRDPSLRRCV